jgi:hypothetical protein
VAHRGGAAVCGEPADPARAADPATAPGARLAGGHFEYPANAAGRDHPGQQHPDRRSRAIGRGQAGRRGQRAQADRSLAIGAGRLEGAHRQALSSGHCRLWASLHDALLKPNWGDPSLGGDPGWGPVKFSHASPRTDNSGSDSLALLAYAYHKKPQLTPADIASTEFQSWLGEIEGRVSDFPASTDTLFGAFLARGPSAYDVVVAYENQAVARVGRAAQWGQLQVIYPSATMLSDHPFAILEASWVAPEQQEAARIFRDYLLGEPAQRLALRYGFRPANTAVSLNDSDPSNMFLNASTIGVRPELPGGVETPAPEVADALLRLWGQQTGR